MKYQIEKPSSKGWCLIPWRVTICINGFFGCMVLYLLRICMSLAIVCMVKSPAVQNTTNNNVTTTASYGYTQTSDATFYVDQSDSSDGCGDVGSKNPTSNNGEFEWDRETQGYILSSFFVGYAITQIPGGWLATRFGGRWLIFMAAAMQALPSLLIPVAARVSPILVMLLRMLMGLGGGVYFPAFHALFGKWAPPLERSKMVSMTYSGTSLGSVLTFIFTGLLCKYGYAGGWPSIFYTYSMVCLLWTVIWFICAHNSPAEHPYISERERDYIEDAIGHKQHEQAPPTPWRAMLTSAPVWAIILVELGSGWVSYSNLTSLPLYMKDVLKLDIQGNGLFNALPHLCNLIGTFLFSSLADFILEKRLLSTTVVRKLAVFIAMVPAAILLIGTGYLTCHQRFGALAMLCIGEFIRGTLRSGSVVNSVDIAPRYSGVIMGFSNTFGTLAGVFAPIATGFLTKNKTQSDWQNVFYLSSIFAIAPTIFFVIFGTGVRQPWDPATITELQKDTELNKVVEVPTSQEFDNPAFQKSDIIKNEK